MPLDERSRRTLAQTLRDGAAALTVSRSPLIDARVLLKFVAGIDDATLIARGDELLAAAEALEFDALIERRGRGEPVAYITGEKEFWSLTFKVTPNVLIPRDDSECLVEAILARRRRDEALNILDLGVGSGCLICALLSEFPESYGMGIDRSESALKLAQANAARLGFAARSVFAVGDWLAPIGRAFDIIIANPPYIPDADRPTLPADVAEFEPEKALFAGKDGMDDYRVIIKGLAAQPGVLRRDGLLVFEAGAGQAGELRQMVKEVLQPIDAALIEDLKGCQRGVAADFRLGEKRD